LREELKNLAEKGLNLESAIPFLTQPTCGRYDCPISHPKIQELLAYQERWYEDQNPLFEPLDVGWVRTLVEVMTNAAQTRVEQLELPYILGSYWVYTQNLRYMETLVKILENDEESCRQKRLIDAFTPW